MANPSSHALIRKAPIARQTIQVIFFAGFFIAIFNVFSMFHYGNAERKALAEANATLELQLQNLLERALNLGGVADEAERAALLKDFLPTQATFLLELADSPLLTVQADDAPSATDVPVLTASGGRAGVLSGVLQQPRDRAMASWNASAHVLRTGIIFANVVLLGALLCMCRLEALSRRYKLAHKHSQEMLVALYEYTHQFVTLLDPVGSIVKANRTSLEIIDANFADVVGKKYWETPWWRDLEEQEMARKAVADGVAGRFSRFQGRIHGVDGQVRIFDVSIKPLVFDQDHVEYILVEGRDVSEMVEATAALEESQGQLMDMAASVPGVIFQLREIADSPSASLLDRFTFSFLSERFSKLFPNHPESIPLSYIARMMRSPDGFLQSFANALENPPRWEYLGQFTNHKGGEGWVRVKARTKRVQHDNTQLTIINGVFLDETEHIQAEEELSKTRDVLQQQEKMASLGSMVAGVAHEINTPLGVALTAATQMQKDVAQISASFDNQTLTAEEMADFVEDTREATRLMVSNCTRAADLVRSFKQVAADQSVQEHRDINLLEYLEDLILSLGPQLKRTPHSLQLECPPDLEATCDPGALAQIVSNLIMNSIAHAFPASDASGVMRIKASVAPAVTLANEDAPCIELQFSDNGVGMTEETRRRAFDPFYTTRRGQGGTGLGLHIVYNLVVNSLGGAINLASAPGDGTTFTIYFPQRPL